MKILLPHHLEELNAYKSDKLYIEATSTKITMRLTAVVAVTNFKTLASAGRAGSGAKFDSRTRTLTVDLRSRSECRPGKLGFGDGGPSAEGFYVGSIFFEADTATLEEVVAIYPHDNFDALLKLAKRLAGKGAKTHSNTREALAKRLEAQRAKANADMHWDGEGPAVAYGSTPPDYMDIPVRSVDSDGKPCWVDAEY